MTNCLNAMTVNCILIEPFQATFKASIQQREQSSSWNDRGSKRERERVQERERFNDKIILITRVMLIIILGHLSHSYSIYFVEV